ncbi:glycosyltransferase [Rudaea cellulosilytica]|uniref:glycosyltransferase n=1 Tax=Rudaea cellulosilytica TaxID=540746 RepID=UPI0012F74245|nr:glycosyltransferase [Rudaea cellulosilytica]
MSDAPRRISPLARALFLLRFLPLYAAMALADWLAPKLPRRWPQPRRERKTAQGISVIVPERGTPGTLAITLDALAAACAKIDEPVQILIVVNGANPVAYTDLRQRHVDFEWEFHEKPLGYDGAIAAGLAKARHPWTYLLNSDMRLAADALAELLPYRQPQVFAVTSQIFFEDASRRREETGWSDFHPHHDKPIVYERTPESGTLARGNLYPGGGSSLCRTAQLRRYVADAHEYHPFYWEDADFGLRAWNEGWEVLFCPTSHCWHGHRGTVNRFYEQDEIERVIARNAQWFDMRHAWTQVSPIEHIRRIAARTPEHWREFAGGARAWRTFRVRLRAGRTRAMGLRYDRITLDNYYGAQPNSATRPRVLLVTPFALFPPAHGGARRIAELVTRLAGKVDFILLSDERSLYSLASEPWLKLVRATHLIEGRGDRPTDVPLTLAERMQRHAWPEMRRKLEQMIALYDPNVVQVEFMELALLADRRKGRARWLLALHDVYLAGDRSSGDAAQITALQRFDAISACSNEDIALLPNANAHLIGNGAIDRRPGAVASPQTPPRLLFMGPFRYTQNREGILAFLDQAWPALKRQFPNLRLTILGGAESKAIAEGDARLTQDGVDLVSAFVDPTPYLAECTVSINPQYDIRGSSIKLIESLLARRVCVSTAAGARGFAREGLQGLVTADDVAGMAAPISALLADAGHRHYIENADDAKLDTHTWDAVAQQQFTLYQQLQGNRQA